SSRMFSSILPPGSRFARSYVSQESPRFSRARRRAKKPGCSFCAGCAGCAVSGVSLDLDLKPNMRAILLEAMHGSPRRYDPRMARAVRKKASHTQTLPHRLRIVGGRWRGMRIDFPPLEAIRPTPDRVRETLFNWLQPYIVGASCLDLFAGSGAL